jgi:hypothetical protein
MNYYDELQEQIIMFAETAKKRSFNKKEIQEYIFVLNERKVYQGLCKKDASVFKTLILENEDCARAVFLELYLKPMSFYNNEIYFSSFIMPTIKEGEITSIFYIEGKGADLAQAQADRFNKTNEIWDSSITQNEIADFVLWFTGNSDIRPAKMPKTKEWNPAFSRPRTINQNLAYMSKVHCFPERLFFYGTKNGYVDLSRELVQEMILVLGIDYAKKFLDKVESYIQSDEDLQDIMIMYSFICSIVGNSKRQVALYFERIHLWLTEKEDFYWNAISLLRDNERKRKIKKAIEKQLTLL